MNPPAPYRVYATSLLTDVEGATESSLPRRDVLADWLRDFLERSGRRGFALAPSELTDLTAVHDYLSSSLVATSPRAKLS